MKHKIVYTGGTFDLFHFGHLNFLRQCSMIGDKVVVALNTDDFIERYKGTAPVIEYEHRKAILESCEYVDEVVPNDNGEDSKPTIVKVQPDFIVIGSDWAGKDYYKQMNFTQEWLDDMGIVLIYVPYVGIVTSTKIKEKIKNA